MKTVLVANRGEIACRVIAGIQQAGLRAVALASTPDLNAPHAALADAVIHLPGESATETYLDYAAFLPQAKALGVDALHPGYGFLSENAAFAQACADAGITFIGPSPAVITAMGDKIEAKRAMAAAGVPVLPSVELSGGDLPDPKDIAAMGYPVLVKAAAGGGGKGMRRVESPELLAASVAAAQREASHAFGDGRVFIEKYIEQPRHVEVQIMGDAHGNAVHLWERECSIQRRHQKIIEESPSPTITHDVRKQLCAAAVAAAKALNYTNAGTVEFIVAPDGQFFFLEVNTRLQVEHPVTELVTGVDLVQWQLQVAQGQRLPLAQADIYQAGHAIEVRLYAEDPAHGFLPATGTLHHFSVPNVPNLRVDSGVVAGQTVGIHYDPMLAKVIAYGENRAAALATLQWALARTEIVGVTTNLGFLQQVLAHPAFVSGDIHTHFLTEYPITPPEPDNYVHALALLADALPNTVGQPKPGGGVAISTSDTTLSPAQLAPRWRMMGGVA